MATVQRRGGGTVTGGVTVAIHNAAELPVETIERVLSEADCGLVEEIDEGTEVVVSGQSRVGATACAEVRELASLPGDRVVILVVERAGAADVRRALQAGANAVVIDTALETALMPSIEATLAGQIAIPAGAGAKGAPQLLTVREKQILGLVVMGMTNAAIAAQLFLAESTVKSHLSSAFAKLGVSSRSEAARVILDPASGAGLGILTIPTK